MWVRKSIRTASSGVMRNCKICGLISNLFFFSSRRRHTRYWRDWSSDVCSSDLLVLDAHTKVKHNGTEETLTQVRQTYWIPQGRQLVKQVIHKCVICTIVEGKAYHLVKPPPLPKRRVTGNYAFQIISLDYAGPLFIRSHSNNFTKTYICPFTCAYLFI